jgi:hypothetical protein
MAVIESSFSAALRKSQVAPTVLRTVGLDAGGSWSESWGVSELNIFMEKFINMMEYNIPIK